MTKENIMKEVNTEMAYIIILSLLLVGSIVTLVVAGKHILAEDPA